MIWDFLLTVGSAFADMFINVFSSVDLPLGLVSGFCNLAAFGAWVLGSDLFLIAWSVLMFFMSLRFIVSLIALVISCIPTMSPKAGS